MSDHGMFSPGNNAGIDPCPSCGVGENGTWDTHFDRSICACGSMHTYCNECGLPVEGCEFESTEGVVTLDARELPRRQPPQGNAALAKETT